MPRGTEHFELAFTMIIPAVPWPPRGPRHCGMPVVALLLWSNYYGIVNLEYKSGIDQSDVDLDWAHVCRQGLGSPRLARCVAPLLL